jgi:hypothetical protein
MLFYDFEAGGKNYRLRLTTRNIVGLEKQLGCNPLSIFGDGSVIPTVSTMINVLFYSMQQYNHGITLNDAYDVFDSFLADGHTVPEFIPVILEVYKVSGIIGREANAGEQNEKN